MSTIDAYSEDVSTAAEDAAMASPISPLGSMPSEAATDPFPSLVPA